MKKTTLIILICLAGFITKVKAQVEPVYQYYNSSTQKHFYTTDYNELGAGGNGWTAQGILGYLHTTDFAQGAVYRFYQGSSGAHYYTKNKSIFPDGFTYETILGYEPGPPEALIIPVYEFVNTTTGDYYYSTSTTVPGGYKLNGQSFTVTGSTP